MSFLIDTDICSAHLKGNVNVTNRFLLYTGQLHISVMTLGELLTWTGRAKASPKRLLDLQAFLGDVHILDFSVVEARKFGEVQAGLLDNGLPAPGMDLVIAATALVRGQTLVTHNVNDYKHIPGLNIVDWMLP